MNPKSTLLKKLTLTGCIAFSLSLLNCTPNSQPNASTQATHAETDAQTQTASTNKTSLDNNTVGENQNTTTISDSNVDTVQIGDNTTTNTTNNITNNIINPTSAPKNEAHVENPQPTAEAVPSSEPEASPTPAPSSSPITSPDPAPSSEASASSEPSPESTATPTPSQTSTSPASILYYQSAESGNKDIYQINTDGSSRIRLTTDAGIDDAPDAYPELFLFESNRDGMTDIYLTNLNSFNPQKLIADSACEGSTKPECMKEHPNLSPDKTTVAFSGRQDGQLNAKIFTVNINGTNLQTLTGENQPSFYPKWSPDGTKILYHANVSDNWDVYVMNHDGSNQINLTPDSSAEDWDAHWSPDGSKIVFESRRDGDLEIFIMNADGTNLLQLTQNETADKQPAWSPDGTQIAFISDRDGNDEIYLMNTDGSGQTRLTTTDADERLPTWAKN